MIFGPLFMILFLAVLVAVVGWPWQGVIQPHRFPPVRTPLDMLIRHTETLKASHRAMKLSLEGCPTCGRFIRCVQDCLAASTYMLAAPIAEG